MKDRFSSHANEYAQFRPTYPSDLYEFIFQHVKHFDAAWDCGTGNGQAARDLSMRFKKVFATDISVKQIQNAYKKENIFYSLANERTEFPDESFDLITVAQAVHWFNMEDFSHEIIRVSKPSGIVALWGYGLLSINPTIDELVNQFYTEVVGPYWDPERRHIDEQYKNLFFPFKEIKSPQFTFSTRWTFEDLAGYLNTWSAVKNYSMAIGENLIDNFMDQLKIYWKDETQTVNFPIFLKMGIIK
jgi:ubiquinone/menaquinone biosynthesis C-methylase UbiE